MNTEFCKAGAVFVALFLLLLHGCASNIAVPVAEEFWQSRSPVVGVALTAVPRPEVRVRAMYSSGMMLPRILFSPDEGDRDNEEQIMIESDRLQLQRILRDSDINGLSAARDLFVRRLSIKGFSVVAIPEHIDPGQVPKYKTKAAGFARKDYRGVLPAMDLDRLIVLQVHRSGVTCHYTERINDFTTAAVTVRGEMIDLATNRLLWSSSGKAGTIRKDIGCSCEKNADAACIIDELNALFDDAAVWLVDDFFANAPQ